MIDAIRHQIGSVKYPAAMFASQQNDTLSDYVYRFLMEEASEQDFGALKGLTTSMS